MIIKRGEWNGYHLEIHRAGQFSRHLGIEITEVSEGRAKTRMEIQRHHLNSAGTVHGGALFSLADAFFAGASNSQGTAAAAITVSISYFKAISSGMLCSEAEEVSINPKLATHVIPITDNNGNRIALFQGTIYTKKNSISEFIK